MHRVGITVAVVGVALASCSRFDPGDVLVSCSSNDDCPGEGAFTCKSDVGFCVPDDALGGQAMELVGELEVGDARLSLVDGFNTLVARAELTERPRQDPDLSLDGATLDCAEDDATLEGAVFAWRCERQLLAGDRAGLHDLRLRAFDEGLNLVEAQAAIFFDFDGPAIVEPLSALELRPGPGNPLTSLSTARAGTRLRFVLGIDEAVAEDPAPVARATGDVEFALTRVPQLEAGDANILVFEGELPPGVLDGALAFELEATDAVGNSAIVEVPLEVVVDNAAPSAPDVATPQALIYRRLPWGNATDGPRFSLRSNAPVVEANGTVLVYESATAGDVEAIAQIPVDSEGRFDEVELSRVDRPRLFVSAADGAGNTSARVEVREVEWVATLRFKVGTRRLENPHQLFTTRRFSTRLFAPGSSEVVFGGQAAGEALVSPDGNALQTNGGAAWIERTPGANRPPARNNPGLAFDEARGRAVLFGGDDGGRLGDLWGVRWRPLAAARGRVRAAAATGPSDGVSPRAGARDRLWG